MTSVLLFLSGFAALVYQVLWMRGLSTVFGSSAHAAAVALAVFFAGLAAGAALFARIAPRVRNALGAYGFLEIGIAASALLFVVLVDVYPRIYAPLYQRFADSTTALVLVKAILAFGALAVPTVLMGATLPAMAQHVHGARGGDAARDSGGATKRTQPQGGDEARRDTAWLYGVNTFGATIGAFAAGFFLLPSVGFRGSYAIAVGTNLLVGAMALVAARTAAGREHPESDVPRADVAALPIPERVIEASRASDSSARAPHHRMTGASRDADSTAASADGAASARGAASADGAAPARGTASARGAAPERSTASARGAAPERGTASARGAASADGAALARGTASARGAAPERGTASASAHGAASARSKNRQPTPDGRRPTAASRAPNAERRVPRGAAPLPERLVVALAFASGVLTIGLEVAWLRMFAQVLDNSVYAFSAVVVVALVAFAAAALVVARAPLASRPGAWLAWTLAAAAMTAAVQGPVFTAITGDLAPLEGAGWLTYVAHVFGTAALFVGVAGFAAGMVFPSLLRFARHSGAPAPAGQPGDSLPGAVLGATVGWLLTLNTAGAIAGSLVTTFVLLPALGLWTTFAVIGAIYALLAVWVGWRPIAAAAQPAGAAGRATGRIDRGRGGTSDARPGRWPTGDGRSRRLAAVGSLAATLLMLAFSPALPRLRLDAARGERVLRVWESAHGTLAVTETRDGRLLRLNNSYSLGGTVDRVERERIQTLIPLLLHPDPKQVFFLGLGTGITAGEALRHPVERVVVCELVPEVVRASAEFFGEWTRGLAADPRVDVRIEDGRHYLASSADTFDVIVSDLFVPWHAGTGMLYTREHFESVRARLRPSGIFAQWLPLFQLNQRDFEVIARTLLEVFPHVVLWRGDFYANRPIVALVASMEPVRVDPARLVSRGRALAPDTSAAGVLAGVLPFYAGNIGEARTLLQHAGLNTDEQPVIEYLSPVTQWSTHSSDGEWFVSTALVRFLDRLRAAVPLARDPHLAALSADERRYVEAGALYHRAIVARLTGDDDEAQDALAQALDRLPVDVEVSGPFLALDALAR